MASPLWCTDISVEIDDHPKSPTTIQHAGASVDIGPLTCRRSSVPFFRLNMIFDRMKAPTPKTLLAVKSLFNQDPLWLGC